VSGARKVLSEMRGQVAAAEAAENLEATLASKQSNSVILKVGVLRAQPGGDSSSRLGYHIFLRFLYLSKGSRKGTEQGWNV